MNEARSQTTTSDRKPPGADNGSKALRNFIELNAVAVCRSNIEGAIFEANQAFCDLLGWTQNDIQERRVRWVDITPPKYIDQVSQAVKGLVIDGKAAPFEKEYIHKDGHLIPVIVAILALDTTGSDWLSFILDLSEQKEAEHQLQVSEAKFRQLSESIPQIVWLADAKTNLVYANRRLYEYSGMTVEELEGDKWFKLMHPDDVSRFVDAWIRSGSYTNAYEMEVRYRSRSGDYRWFLARTAPVINERKEVLMWVGTSTDIDEQKNDEYDLKESERQYRTLADAIPQIVWTATPNGEIDFFNHRWFEYTGLTWSQSVDNGWTLLIHPDDRKEYLAKWQEALLSGDTYEQEFRLRRAVGINSSAEGRYRWHLGRAVALRNEDGTIQKWFATWTEIEDQKSKEKR
jgi:PAS domain S-box-containing protein